MKTPALWSVVTAFAALAALPLSAATPLADFETDADVAALKARSQGWSTLERSPIFATAGQSSLRLASPAWKKGLPEWPSLENQPAITNWTGYDRLVVDLTNPNAEKYFFSLFVSDDKVPFRQGLSYRFDVPAHGFRRCEVPLSTFPKTVNRSNIAVLHFFTQRPQSDLALHLDNLTLLRPGETLPEPGSAFAKQLAGLTLDGLGKAEQVFAKCRAQIDSLTAGAAIRASGLRQLAALEEPFKNLRAELIAGPQTLARLTQINAELAALPKRAERTLSAIRLQNACAEAGQPATRLLVATATSMEKILPRDAAFDLMPAQKIELSLARNEKESFQLAVLPVAGALRKVTVKAADLKGPRAVFKAENLQCEVVGYVQTRKEPPYGTSQVGWWPDPILNFLGPIDIAEGDLQAFWIRVRAPKDQPPGLYRGKLTVAA